MSTSKDQTLFRRSRGVKPIDKVGANEEGCFLVGDSSTKTSYTIAYFVAYVMATAADVQQLITIVSSCVVLFRGESYEEIIMYNT